MRRRKNRCSWMYHEFLEAVEHQWIKLMAVLVFLFLIVLAALLLNLLLKNPPSWLFGQVLTVFQSGAILTGLFLLMLATCFIKYHQTVHKKMRRLADLAAVDETTLTEPLWTQDNETEGDRRIRAIPPQLKEVEIEMGRLKRRVYEEILQRSQEDGQAASADGPDFPDAPLGVPGEIMLRWLRADMERWRGYLDKCEAGGVNVNADGRSDGPSPRDENPVRSPPALSPPTSQSGQRVELEESSSAAGVSSRPRRNPHRINSSSFPVLIVPKRGSRAFTAPRRFDPDGERSEDATELTYEPHRSDESGSGYSSEWEPQSFHSMHSEVAMPQIPPPRSVRKKASVKRVGPSQDSRRASLTPPVTDAPAASAPAVVEHVAADAAPAEAPVVEPPVEKQVAALDPRLPPRDQPLYYGDMRVCLLGFGDLVLNQNCPRPFETEGFVGQVHVRVKHAEGAPYDSYFDGRNRLFSIEVKGRFKGDFTGDDVVYGAAFQRPIAFPTGFGLCVRMANKIDPGLVINWKTDKPTFLSPLLCSMNECEGSNVPPMPSSKRRQHFKNAEARKAFTFKANEEYRFELYGNMVNWATMDVCIGPLKVNACRFMGGQAVCMQAMSRSTGVVFFATEFDHKRLHTV